METIFCNECIHVLKVSAQKLKVSTRRKLNDKKYIFVILCFISLKSCTNNIAPPLQLKDPVQAYLVDHGRHPSLILTRSNGSLVRYAYGDWRWYALGNESIWGAMHAILWPSQGALGRREFSQDAQSFQRGGPISEGFARIYPFQVERDKSEALQHRLDEAYQREKDSMIFNSRYELDFVPYPRRYWFAHHSNRIMGHWLSDLGCQVQGSLMLSNWHFAQADHSGGRD